MRITWIKPEELLEHELTQAQVEGKEVQKLKAQWEEEKARLADPAQLRTMAEKYWRALEELEPGPSEQDEPSGLEGIFALSSPDQFAPAGDLDAALLADKVKGGWLGRAAGCLLGKPVEGKPRHWIRQLLEASGRWPLDDYFTAQGVPEEVFQEYTWHKSYVESLRRTSPACQKMMT